MGSSAGTLLDTCFGAGLRATLWGLWSPVLRGRRSRFRSSFRDYPAEQTRTPHSVMEAALAHVVKNKTEAVCARSDLFEKPRALMESWSTTSPPDGAAIARTRTRFPTRWPR